MTLSDKAREKAAQLWCLPHFGNREMDVEFALAISEAMVSFANEVLEAAANVAEGIRKSVSGAGACNYNPRKEERIIVSKEIRDKIRSLKERK